MSTKLAPPTNTLQTLDRGLQALDVICQLAQGITVAELAAALQVNRAIAYRLVNTLELHGLVARAAGGRIVAG
ncbi:MAG: helix-turn-helix domain-containing protein, partial [Ottowia sp.]|nr:helix-turn-helix domain-containing protein [Ottowia sp.]